LEEEVKGKKRREGNEMERKKKCVGENGKTGRL
jgi:hypothetical protein